jgi:hypothetical protein
MSKCKNVVQLRGTDWAMSKTHYDNMMKAFVKVYPKYKSFLHENLEFEVTIKKPLSEVVVMAMPDIKYRAHIATKAMVKSNVCITAQE